MATTVEMKIFTGSGGTTESPAGDASNWNMMSTDAYDTTDTQYQTNGIAIPESGTGYSYEKHIKYKFTGDFNLIENCVAYIYSGTLVDAGIDVLGGVTDSDYTPVNTVSAVATTSLSDWDELGEAIDIQDGTMDTSPEYTKTLVAQTSVASTTAVTGDIASGGLTLRLVYDLS